MSMQAEAQRRRQRAGGGPTRATADACACCGMARPRRLLSTRFSAPWLLQTPCPVCGASVDLEHSNGRPGAANRGGAPGGTLLAPGPGQGGNPGRCGARNPSHNAEVAALLSNAAPPPPPAGLPTAGRFVEAQRAQLASLNFAAQCQLHDARLDENTPPGEGGAYGSGAAATIAAPAVFFFLQPPRRCCCCRCRAPPASPALRRCSCGLRYPAEELSELENEVRVSTAGLKTLAAAAAAAGER